MQIENQISFLFLTKHRNGNWYLTSWTTDTQWRHKSKKSEILGRCGWQNMLRPYLKIWDWDFICGHAVKAISSPGVRSPCYYVSVLLSTFAQSKSQVCHEVYKVIEKWRIKKAKYFTSGSKIIWCLETWFVFVNSLCLVRQRLMGGLCAAWLCS